MRFAIRYLTEYAYDAPVTDNLNVLRVTPATTPTQQLDEWRLRVDPDTRLHRYVDYYGTHVVEFDIVRPHDHLNIDVRARVTTTAPAAPPEGPWDALRTRGYEAAAGEFGMVDARDDGARPALEELCDALRDTTPAATARRLCEVIPDRFEYRSGVTYVGSTVEHLLNTGAGVCQDFVHLSLLLLRDLGIAARYVSGYFYVPPAGDPDAASAEMQTHAWLEALLPGEGDGADCRWVGLDPTNRRLAGEEHVKIGHGRRYADIPPVKGVYRGPAGSRMEASVHMRRVDAAGAPVGA